MLQANVITTILLFKLAQRRLSCRIPEGATRFVASPTSVRPTRPSRIDCLRSTPTTPCYCSTRRRSSAVNSSSTTRTDGPASTSRGERRGFSSRFRGVEFRFLSVLPTPSSRSIPLLAGSQGTGHFPSEQAAVKCLYLFTRSLDPTGQGTMDGAGEASAQRVRDHLRRPIPGSRDVPMETAGNTLSEIARPPGGERLHCGSLRRVSDCVPLRG
jgi:hypothetical protein